MSALGRATAAVLELADFDKVRIGESAHLTRRITAESVAAFAALSGDYNPLHMEDSFARGTGFQRRVAHGMLVASYVSTLIGMHVPGPGALWMEQRFRWIAPVFIDDELSITATVTHKSSGTRTLMMSVRAVNQQGIAVMEGEGTVSVLDQRRRGEDLSIAERVALVTGGARGIGAAIAAALAEAGAAVAVSYLASEADSEDLCRTIRAQGGRAMAVRADVADADAMSSTVDLIAREMGKPVDVLINNAGAPHVPRPFLQTGWDEMQAQIDVSLRGAFNCCKAVVPGMTALKSGRIVNIGCSLNANVPPAHWTAFLTAKAALKSLTRSLAVELGPSGIRVNMVSPGMTDTEFISNVPERLRKVQAMQTPLRRLGTPGDVARAVLALCSDTGEFITGADLPVCGGFSM